MAQILVEKGGADIDKYALIGWFPLGEAFFLRPVPQFDI
jgi:hypothetical protein